jgi:hypothetical protein
MKNIVPGRVEVCPLVIDVDVSVTDKRLSHKDMISESGALQCDESVL